jgi:hypothetical protein
VNKREYNKQLKKARELDKRNYDFVYSYESGVHFTYEIEKYCKLIKPENYPFSNDCRLVFNIEKIKKDNILEIPKKLKSLEINITPNAIFEIKEEVCCWGYDGFKVFLQKVLETKNLL